MRKSRRVSGGPPLGAPKTMIGGKGPGTAPAIELPGMNVNGKNVGFVPGLTEMFHDVTALVASS